MAQIRLLSTDFDGTLVAHPSDGRCSPAFADVLVQHSHAGGAWAINTGRSLQHAIEGLDIFRPPVLPDFLLTSEREIYRRNADGDWHPHAEWNDACTRRHDELFEQSGEILGLLLEYASDTEHVTVIEEDSRPVGLVTSTEMVMDDVTAFIDGHSARCPEFGYQRNTVYLRFCHRDYHKGATLGELCSLLQLDAEHVLAAGDHFNDLPMLDGRYAKFPCCPSNAIPVVQDTVRKSGGHVAEGIAADGVAEAWHIFTSRT